MRHAIPVEATERPTTQIPRAPAVRNRCVQNEISACLHSFRSMSSEFATYFVPELNRIEPVAVPENDADVANGARVRSKITTHHHQIRRLARLDRSNALLLTEDAGPVE